MNKSYNRAVEQLTVKVRNLSDDFRFWGIFANFSLNNVTKLASKPMKFTTIIETIVEINLLIFAEFS